MLKTLLLAGFLAVPSAALACEAGSPLRRIHSVRAKAPKSIQPVLLLRRVPLQVDFRALSIIAAKKRAVRLGPVSAPLSSAR